MNFKLILFLMMILILPLGLSDNWVSLFINSDKIQQQLEENKEVYDWESAILTMPEMNIQEKSTESDIPVRLDDLLHEIKVEQQFEIQDLILDLIVGVFVLILDIIVVTYYIFELWFFMKLFLDWIPSLFKKLAISTGQFIVKVRDRK
jgi:hypothetical protein